VARTSPSHRYPCSDLVHPRVTQTQTHDLGTEGQHSAEIVDVASTSQANNVNTSRACGCHEAIAQVLTQGITQCGDAVILVCLVGRNLKISNIMGMTLP
jgi:hypothetical protein